ncbi:MarR family transcriptional regulator [Bacteroides fragilis]|nr:MarR family transcriptional regulator [Bacteroides fragilis]MCS2878853.1 MarR family transcriptional regulator [Bacteroides fragilis]
MKNKQKIPVSISASREVFDYLKEKGSDRKTKTEAYCDLLDKASAGFVSPFLRKQGNELLPNQCHLTVSDLASEWHWHRATVRSFLDAMEEFGLLNRTRLPKSVIITMTVQSDQSVQSRNVQEQPDFADQFRDVLSDWVIGKTTTAEAGIACGQLVRRAMTGVADPETGRCPDSRSDMASAYPDISDTDIRGIALGCIAHAALQKILRRSRFDDSSPLVDFFRLDLGEEWSAFLEASKELAELILDTEAHDTGFGMDEDKECLKSLRKPFLSLLSKTREMAG